MILKNIKITNFKSLYGEHYFDFTQLDGLIKLYGPIGAGKTSLAEAILYGLYGTVKGHNNNHLISWNCKSCKVELNLISNNKEVNIVRDIFQPLEVKVNGKIIAASNKRGTQEILEEEIYDVNKLAIERMCIISFNQFNSIANMNPGQTREFLDNIFGFKTFTMYNDLVVAERKDELLEQTRLLTIYNETENQIQHLENKLAEQKANVKADCNIDALTKDKDELIENGKKEKEIYDAEIESFNQKKQTLNDEKMVFYNKKMEYATLGKQEKEWYNTFKSGKCPTCGHDIDESALKERHQKMMEYAELYKEEEKKEKEVQQKIDNLNIEITQYKTDYNNRIADIKTKINEINSQITVYNSQIATINENYTGLIDEYTAKMSATKEQLDKSDLEIGEWNEMNDLFAKTLRYKLLNSLIPQINKSIQYFTNKLDLSYSIEFDQEFKSHIYVENNDKQINYTDLSTGQRKSIDVAIIFGIIQNVIASVNFSVFFLDELFSNMDSNSINNMLSLLKESLSEDRTIFVVNHNDMPDDYFNHKIKVMLNDKKITEGLKNKKKAYNIAKVSEYRQIF